MKKIMGLLLSVVLVTGLFSMTGCGITKIDNDYLLTTINEVVADLSDDDIAELIEYHSAVAGEEEDIPTLSLAIPTNEELKANKSGTLVVATEAEFPPFEYISGGEVAGFDMDIMKLVADKLDMNIKFVDVEFDSIVTGVKAGTYHVGAAGLTITDERKDIVNFSDAYYESTQYAISGPGYTSGSDHETEEGAGHICCMKELVGKKIGVQAGTTGHFMVDDSMNSGDLKGTGATLKEFTSGASAMLGLKNNTIDVIVLDMLPALALASKNEGYEAHYLKDQDPEYFGFVVAK